MSKYMYHLPFVLINLERGNYMAPSEATTLGLFQIIFQLCGGVVGLTDNVFWFIIYPFLTPEGYSLNFLDVSMHSLNAILLIIDMSLYRLLSFFNGLFMLVYQCGGHIRFLIYHLHMLPFDEDMKP